MNSKITQALSDTASGDIMKYLGHDILRKNFAPRFLAPKKKTK